MKAVKVIKDATYEITGICRFDFTQPTGQELPQNKVSEKYPPITGQRQIRAQKQNRFTGRKDNGR
ncbi:MAG: hypothetical protein LBJ73_01160 [Rickettsiales bacterium]|nr:hypothetical protein [Rickettsiales bacterium]